MPRSRPIAPACAKAAKPTASRSACSRSISDWEAQARAIVEGIRVDDKKTRVLLVDLKFRVIASSDGQGLLTERVPLKGGRSGFTTDGSGLQVAFHLTRLRDLQGSRLVRRDPPLGVGGCSARTLRACSVI